MAAGSFFFVVGPSGAGKDSLLDGARPLLDPSRFIFAKRTITRPEGSPGEVHTACTEPDFHALNAAGKFLITWQAHGLHYGLPIELVDALTSGQHVIANGSRSMIAALNKLVPNLVVIEINAPPHVLQARLSARGRETADDIAKRLSRTVEPYPDGVPRLNVVNDQSLAIGTIRLLATLLTQTDSAAPSSRILFKKIAGSALTPLEYQTAIETILSGKTPEAELQAFLIACTVELSDEEMIAIAKARTKILPRIDWGRPMVVDKHSLGGLPGSRVTMVVIPIVAAHGLMIPKTSSRAITSAAGTADAMEVIAKVDLTPEELKQCVAKANACIAWNGKLNHSVLDDAMNAITRPLGLDTRKWSVASILSKKYSAGATHVVIDIPYAEAGKVKSKADGIVLGQLFEMVGRELGLVVKAFATSGESPIGRGIGPSLEVRDVLQVLERHPDAPSDLLEKSLFFASQILAMDPAVGTVEKGAEVAERLLHSGAAREAMENIIQAQGSHDWPDLSSILKHPVYATQAGTVRQIDGFVISGLARMAGAPFDKLAGVDIVKPAGSRVQAG
ncbi:MAG: phosphonate metabolism protein/1,5-bisphosphokinase (PRPP-forming) PhnN, partial [Betaproteobacteria bacterium]